MNSADLKKAQKTAADLRVGLIDLVKEGFGKEVIGTDEERELQLTLEANMEKVFGLYAQIQMARALGIEDWLAAEIGLTMTSDGGYDSDS